MVVIKVYEKYSKQAADGVSHAFLQAGIYLDRMTRSNLISNVKAIDKYLTETYAHFMSYCAWWQDEVQKRKTKDKDVLGIIDGFRKTGEKILLFQKYVLDIIPELKKKELEIPGERKKLEDENNFQAAKKARKVKYNELDQYLQEDRLLEQFEELGEALFQPELQLPDLRESLNSIAAKTRKPYSEANKKELLAEIQLYLRKLMELSKAVSQEFDEILVNILGEMGIWKNVLRNLRNMNAQNYDQLVAQLLVLLHDDNKIYQQIEAA